MSFNKSNSSGELSDRVVTPLRMFRQISPSSNDNIQSLSDSPLLDDHQQQQITKGAKKTINPSELDKQMARRRELELWRLKKKSSTTPPTTSSGTSTKVVQQVSTAAQITSPFSSNQRLRRTQNNPTTNNNNPTINKPTTFGTQKLLFSELSPRRERAPDSRKRKSANNDQPSIHPPPKKILTNNASNPRGNIKPETRNVQPINRPPQVSTTRFAPVKVQPANETNQLNLSSILIVEDRTLFEEDKHMLDNIVKITDSLDNEPTIEIQQQLPMNSSILRENETVSQKVKIEETKSNTNFSNNNNEPSILLDVSYTGSEPRSARKSMKQKSFLSNPANSVAFSPLVNKSKSLTTSLLTPVNTMESLTRAGGLFEFSLLNDSKPSTTKGASQLLPDLTNPTNLSSLTKTINLNTSISNDLDQLKLKIVELEENLKKERKEKEMWMERYKNLFSNIQSTATTNTSLLSRSFTTIPQNDSKLSLNRSFNNGNFQTETIKR